jgi:single-stranded-DNA-specific exonuclease
VALGTIADMVPLCGENRILVACGMQRLKSTLRPGIVALKQIAQCSAAVTTHEVGFQLAPRLNATGRLETAEQSLRLLRSADLPSALPLARALDQCNRDRQSVERELLEESLATVQGRFNPARIFVIVEGHPRWHIGVVGIIASRILQQFYRPTIILGGDGAVLRGPVAASTGLIWGLR